MTELGHSHVFLLSLSLAADKADENYLAYQTWLGIKYFWGPSGPAELGYFPDNAAQTDGGRKALNFRQKHIDNFRTKITPLLDIHSSAGAVSSGNSSEGGSQEGSRGGGLPDGRMMEMGWDFSNLA
jgi:hypothetical protein